MTQCRLMERGTTEYSKAKQQAEREDGPGLSDEGEREMKAEQDYNPEDEMDHHAGLPSTRLGTGACQAEDWFFP